MITTILSHEVKNYNIYKKVFERDVENSSKLGLNITGVYKSSKNPKMITLICEIPSKETITSFHAWSKLNELLQKVGIESKPEVKLLYKL
jgi:hypothetical protein